MGRWIAFGAAVALAALAVVPASADSKDKKKGSILRWAHTYEQAAAESKERNCVIYVTIHAEH